MKSIVFFEVKDWEKAYLREHLEGCRMEFFDGVLSEQSVAKAQKAEAISVFIYSKLTKELLARMPKLKAIFTRSTGFDHIDAEECKRRAITIYTVPSYGENTVAEHTFALILSISRNIHKSYVRTMRNDFSINDLTGFDLKGKTLGVIGGGRIGMHVARMAKGFGMEVIVYDAFKQPFMAEIIGFSYAELDDLLRRADIVSIHLPYNEKTHHLLDKEKFGIMKKGAIIINTARGGIIDTDALVIALESKQLGGAGLDVIEGEELIKEEKELLHCEGERCKWRPLIERNNRLFKMDNVVFTPHNAFNSREALVRIVDTTIENIRLFLRK